MSVRAAVATQEAVTPAAVTSAGNKVRRSTAIACYVSYQCHQQIESAGMWEAVHDLELGRCTGPVVFALAHGPHLDMPTMA